MKRHIMFCLGVFFCAPAIAHAITITAGTHYLNYNQAGQDITITLSGASESEMYTDSNLRLLIATGGPVITAVFGITAQGAIPSANLAGSIWQGGAGGIAHSPDGLAPPDSGQRLIAGLNTGSFVPTSANGTYAVLTIDTTGVAPGTYAFSVTDHPIKSTDLFNGFIDEIDFEPMPTNLTLENGFLVVTPEPASIVIGLSAIAGLLAIAARRRRAHR
jgi:hypothetical protein